MSRNQSQALQQLKTQMQSTFNLNELKALCFTLNVTYDEIAGETLGTKIISLITFLGRRNELSKLVDYLKTKREIINWPDITWTELNQSDIENFNAQTLSTEDRIDREVVLEKLSQNYSDILTRMFDADGKLERIPFTNLEDLPNAVETEDDKIPGFPSRTQRSFISGTSVGDIFTELGFGLLILGEPGYGKTAAVYDLANSLINEAKQDLWAPLPVIVNLSTWNPDEFPSLEEWIQSRLQKRYFIPSTTSKTWLAKGNMILFLDALDEIQPQHAQTCVKVISHFQESKLHARIVVTSRATEYYDLGVKLNLPGAVQLLPLTEDQVQTYFDHLDIQPDTSDEEVGELLKEPLMLNIFSRIALSKMELTRGEGRQISRTTLLNDYIQMLFNRRRMQSKNEKETCNQLSYIAQQMDSAEVYDLDLEQLQPTWLTEEKHRRTYNFYVMFFVFCIFEIVFFLIFTPIGLATRVDAQPILDGMIGWGYTDLSPTIINVGVLLIKFGISFFITLFVGGFIGIGAAIVTRILLKFRPVIKPVNRFVLPQFGQVRRLESFGIVIRTALLFIGLGLLVAISIMFIFSSFSNRIASQLNIISAFLIFGVGFGIAGTIFGLFLTTFEYDDSEKEENRSNPRIWRSGQTGLVIGLVAFVIVTFVFALILFKVAPTMGSLYIVMFVSITLGVSLGLFYGGHVFIRHYILRWLLARYNYLPRQLESFLNDMSAFTFLQKVGVGYRFFHATAQEHFANLTQWPPED